MRWRKENAWNYICENVETCEDIQITQMSTQCTEMEEKHNKAKLQADVFVL